MQMSLGIKFYDPSFKKNLFSKLQLVPEPEYRRFLIYVNRDSWQVL